MPFPQIKQRVIYKNNPLDQVVCQLRFPNILRISAEIPYEFQEKIRAEFPEYKESSEFAVNLQKPENDSFPVELLKEVQHSTNNKNYQFISEDKNWKVNLTNSFIAFSSSKYNNWEEFKEKLQLPLNALIDTYKPAKFTRIGLRYVDIIKRSKLNLKDADWDELLKPSFLGILSSKEGKNVQAFESRHEIKLSDEESLVNLFTRFVRDLKDEEICFVIDSDFFLFKSVEVSNAITKLDYFNKRASRLLQWCITKKLHNAMEPQSYAYPK